MIKTMMEKITLKPVVKELLYKTDEVNTHFDVLAYSGANTQEKTLGSLCFVGHVAYGEEEDLGYVISLAASLAKREYYSDTSVRGQDPRKAFENTLKKLNEVLEDFFKNKTTALSIGLAAIAGDQIFISKLGKFKVALARGGEHIDVLNNITLFQKSSENERQFSNIISGQLQPNDKIFAFYPGRPITSRERMLQGVLIKEPQAQFTEKIAQLADVNDTFSCCGLHISMEQIKEIPIEIPQPAVPPITLAAEPPLARQNLEKPKVIAAELSFAKRRGIIDYMVSAAGKIRSRGGFTVTALIILVPLIAFAAIKTAGNSNEIKTAYRQGVENLKTIQTKLAQNDTREARALIQQTLAQIKSYEDDEKIEELAAELRSSLDSVDKVNQTVPEIVATLDVAEEAASILAFDDSGTPYVRYNGMELISVGSREYTLKDPLSSTDAKLYEGNLYTLVGNEIYKYADVVNGRTERALWGAFEENLTSIAVDGNVYGLLRDGRVEVYFKGKKEREFTPQIPAAENGKIFAQSDGQFLYILNPEARRLYAVSKDTGNLETSYRLDQIGEIKNIALSTRGDILLLSSENKLWSISVQP